MNENSYLLNMRAFVQDANEVQGQDVSAVNILSGLPPVQYYFAPTSIGTVQQIIARLILNSAQLTSTFLHVALDTVTYNNILTNSAEWSKSDSNWNDILIQDTTTATQATSPADYYIMSSLSGPFSFQFSLASAR